jgi:aspartokinase
MNAGQPLSETAQRRAPVHFERERGVAEVSVTRGLAHVTVRLPGENIGSERLRLLQELAAANVSLFLIKLHPDSISFAVRADVVDACESLLRDHGFDHTFLRDLSLVAVVAGAMRDLSGVMARIYEALVRVNVGVRQTGDAYNAVLCLVAGDEAERAAEALRDAFALRENDVSAGQAAGGVGIKPL